MFTIQQIILFMVFFSMACGYIGEKIYDKIVERIWRRTIRKDVMSRVRKGKE